jgi:hypothetical protein
VLRADVVVIEHLGFFLRQDNDAASAVGKSLKHFSPISTVVFVSSAGLAFESNAVLLLKMPLFAHGVSWNGDVRWRGNIWCHGINT